MSDEDNELDLVIQSGRRQGIDGKFDKLVVRPRRERLLSVVVYSTYDMDTGAIDYRSRPLMWASRDSCYSNPSKEIESRIGGRGYVKGDR
jgi:hypothetical protein